VFGNPPPYWVAAWNNSPTLERGWSHQYASPASYDLSVFPVDAPLWDTQAPTPPPPPPKKDEPMWIFELPDGGLFTSNLVNFRWLTGDAIPTAQWLIAAAGGPASPIKVARWQDMGVPADPGSASAVGVAFPASAS
jgi:hypothetical protein